jgi:hypothetical protein
LLLFSFCFCFWHCDDDDQSYLTNPWWNLIPICFKTGLWVCQNIFCYCCQHFVTNG